MARIRPFGTAFARTPADGRSGFHEIDGSSPPVVALKRDMASVAHDADVTVLISGESGTGKERVAQAIHRASPRAGAPFVVVDCAGMAATLAEDALFGHVRGAFTGAVDDRAGPFERANGGTVLLDEVGDLPRDLQMKLLRAVQSRTVQRLGGSHTIPFDVRIIAATHVDLAEAVSRGRFRDDLYYRLKVYEIVVPPLRRRGADDLGVLTTAIVRRLADRRGGAVPAIAPDAGERLAGHEWPGNVRELENVLERMIVAAAGEPVLRTVHMPAYLRGSGASSTSRRELPGVERIVETLRRTGFSCARTATELGLSRHQVYRLVKRHGIRGSATER
jgi:transcriptional regulator with GAF, ATPase, and Fis domain